MRHTFNKTLLVTSIVLALGSQAAFATNGMAPIGLGVVQKGMGGAATATSENVMNAGTNPASLSNVSAGWEIGAEVFMPDRGATITGNDMGGGNTANGSYDGNGKEMFLIPEGGYKKQLNDKHSVGVVVYGNGGMNTSYDRPILLFDQTNTTKPGINLEQLIIAPTWSMKINENNSVGVSVNLAYQQFKATGLSNFNQATQTSSVGNVTDRGVDSSSGIGATIGWQGKLSPTVTAGVAYRSRTNMGKLDKYKGLFAEQGDLDMPAATTAGIAWQATPKTLIAADVQQIEYSKVKAMANLNTAGGLLGADNGSGFGWKDQTVYKLGVKHQVKPNFAVLAGYNHAKNPLQSSQTLFNVLAPATVEDHVSLGGEWKLNNKANLAAVYTHALSKGVNGSGSIAGTSGSGEANLNMKQNSVGVAYSVDF
ncbi:MAG: outer membrane protein transport protein [Thiothrix sp.]|uniref:OmpP1/FadL family transporter n=1 Tax=Thiothrix sp. TaxID=1032 RepID=UPI00260501B1|nr:outer membrane protein transport protein [Thiothrix sp.]MDD5392080.1 outer membrane protein transport protein [Thiothrix sp.]